jgi:uncharacterized protein
MPSYLSPGVYVEEVSSGSQTISGVGTSMGAFVGIAEMGPVGEPVSITSWKGFTRVFGGFLADYYLAYSVYNFFAEGGAACYVVRTCHYNTEGNPTAVPALLTLRDKDGKPCLQVTAKSPGACGNQLYLKNEISKFTLRVLIDSKETETYCNLDMSNIEKSINNVSSYLMVATKWTGDNDKLFGTGKIPLETPADGTGPSNNTIILNGADGEQSLKITPVSGASDWSKLTVAIEYSSFKLTVSFVAKDGKDTVLEVFDKLTPAKVESTVNTASKTITVELTDDSGQITTGPGRFPNKEQKEAFRQGADGTPGAISAGYTLEDSGKKPCLHVTAITAGASGNQILLKNEINNEDGSFTLTVSLKTDENSTETFPGLTPDNIEDTINDQSKLIVVAQNRWYDEYSILTTGTSGIPAVLSETQLEGGADTGNSLAVTDFIPVDGSSRGLHAFDRTNGINIVAIPDSVKLATSTDVEFLQSVISEALLYCSQREDCFYIADPPPVKSVTDIQSFKNFKSSYGALYYPWVMVNDPLTGGTKQVPPSGAAAGTYAYTDSHRGVHKAPAGTSDGYLDSVLGLERIVTTGEQDQLNPAGINVIRSLPDGICIWGARTLSDDSEWRYINVRRLLIYIEESLDEGTQWVVFEPNNPALWGSVKRNITAFLTRVWRDGALFGTIADEAFFVKVDAENNPQEVRDAGELIVEVGVAPVKPAEFVIIRICQQTSP